MSRSDAALTNMNAKNPAGPVGYRTPTAHPTGHVTRLLKPEPRTIPQLTKAQRIMREHMDEAGDFQFDDCNRHERRVMMSEARCYARAKAKKEALKRKRAARKLVEL